MCVSCASTGLCGGQRVTAVPTATTVDNGLMGNGWRPIAELRSGHYAVGLLDDGHEVDIFRARSTLLNVATGAKIAGVIGWHMRDVKPLNGN